MHKRLTDWLKEVTWLGTANHRALFHRSIAKATLKFAFDINSTGSMIEILALIFATLIFLKLSDLFKNLNFQSESYSVSDPSAVWPDLAKFRHFGIFLTVYFVFDNIVLIFIVANGQILKNNLIILSHCRTSVTLRAAKKTGNLFLLSAKIQKLNSW